MGWRRPGLWWGAAVEATDPAALARFYADLLGWPVVQEDPGTSVVGAPGGAFLVFQQVDGYRPPVWPPQPGQPRPMMHLDVQVATSTRPRPTPSPSAPPWPPSSPGRTSGCS